MQGQRHVLLVAVGFFTVWAVATWIFEGRIQTLLRADATADRIVYAFAVNLLLGIGGGLLLLRVWVKRGVTTPGRIGFQPSRRTVWAVCSGFALGLAAYFLQGTPSTNPVVIGNAFAQVFVVSAAEVVVCWAVVGAATEAALHRRGTVLSTGGAAVVASVLFGLYHYAHSAPFNTLPMVALLSVVGLVTGAFFFVSRDVFGTVVFHNFLGTFGVLKALAAANALNSLERWQMPLLFTATLTGLVLAAGYLLLSRGSALRSIPDATARRIPRPFQW